MPTWTITANDRNLSYKKLNFERKLIMNSPTEFKATVKYDTAHPIHFMDTILIKRDTVTEWKGYVEKIRSYWDTDGQYLDISGRDASFILWKKYSDDFTNFAQKTAGFFGTVNPVALLRFLLHTPKSDIGPAIYDDYDEYNHPVDGSTLISGYPFNKEGWGLDFNATLGVPTCAISDSKKQQGNPAWTIARQRGYGWFSGGAPYYNNNVSSIASINTYDTEWGTTSPYKIGMDSSYHATGLVTKGKKIIFNMQPVSFTGNLEDCNINVEYLCTLWNQSGFPVVGAFDMEVYLNSKGAWKKINGDTSITSSILDTNKWLSTSFSLKNVITTADLASSNLKTRITITTPSLGTLCAGVAIRKINIAGADSTVTYSQNTGDIISFPLYKGDTPSSKNITALYFECRTDTTCYPRHFTVEYSNNGGSTWVKIPNTYPDLPCDLPSVPVASNTPRDILISFPPINATNVRMKLTGSYSGKPWGVSQVYIYKSEDTKYKPFLDTGETDPSQYINKDTESYTYYGGPYIRKFEDLTNTSCKAVGPLNISRQRLIDAVNYVITLSSATEVLNNNTVGFKPLEWWLKLDVDNTFCIKEEKGQDLSNTITFESGIHVGSVDFNTWIDDTTQNIYVVGQGEQKKLEDTSLWVRSKDSTEGNASNGQPLVTAENRVRTTYDDVEQDKTIIINDSDFPQVAQVIGDAKLTINAMPRVQLKVKVSYDPYDSMAYDVGDTVTIIDQPNGLGPHSRILYPNVYDTTEGKYRIQNIAVSVSANTGESITLTLGYPNYKYMDEMQTLLNKIKTMGLVGCFNSDWTAEGTDKTLLDANLISSQSTYSFNASNDKMAQTIDYNTTLFNTLDYNIDTKEIATNAERFMWSSDWFGIQPSTDSKNHWLQVVLLGNPCDFYNANDPRADPTTGLVKGVDSADLSMMNNPHLSMDIKIGDGTALDIAGLSWTYDSWQEGDYVRIGMATKDGRYGFWFLFIKVAQEPAIFDVYTMFSLPPLLNSEGTEVLPEYTNCCPSGINIDNSPYTGPDTGKTYPTPNGDYIKTIFANRRYKIDISTQCDPLFIRSSAPNVKFNIYEYKEAVTTNSKAQSLSYIQMTYPAMGICSDERIAALTSVKPLYVECKNQPYGGASANQPPVMYFYSYSTTWSTKQIAVQAKT